MKTFFAEGAMYEAVNEGGAWVRHEDAERLEEENRRLRALLEKLIADVRADLNLPEALDREPMAGG